MILCDLCGQAKKCLLKEIEGKEYDICVACWEPIAEKLKGKGRKPKKHDSVFLPPITTESERPEPAHPAEPPRIVGGSGALQ